MEHYLFFVYIWAGEKFFKLKSMVSIKRWMNSTAWLITSVQQVGLKTLKIWSLTGRCSYTWNVQRISETLVNQLEKDKNSRKLRKWQTAHGRKNMIREQTHEIMFNLISEKGGTNYHLNTTEKMYFYWW